MKPFIKKHVNLLILLFIVLNVALINVSFFKSSEMSKTIIVSDKNSFVESISVNYTITGNPFANIKITEITDTTENVNNVSENAQLGLSFDISGNFSNAQLQVATVTLKYDKDLLPEDVIEDNIGVLWYDEENNKMVEMETTVDKENETITFITEHFSEYILIDTSVWDEIWEKAIAQIRDENSEFSVEFIIDDSGSMATNDPRDKRITAAKSAITTLSSEDNFMIMQFSSSSKVVQDFTSNQSVSDSVWNSFKSSGGTDIVGAVEKGIELFENEEDGRIKLIILLTDGEDSQLASKKNELVKKATEANILIFAIGLQSSSDSDLNFETLSELAIETNGEFYEINETQLSSIFTEITNYIVGVDGTLDTDGDGLADWIELSGMRDQYGNIIVTNPYAWDTDGDGISDGVEMGSIAYDVSGHISYYERISYPLIDDNAYELGPSDDAIEVYDSGFRTNVNAFSFRNLIFNDYEGLCYGFAIFTEKVYNGTLSLEDGTYGFYLPEAYFGTLIQSKRLYDYKVKNQSLQLPKSEAEYSVPDIEWTDLEGNDLILLSELVEQYKTQFDIFSMGLDNVAAATYLTNNAVKKLEDIFENGQIVTVHLTKVTGMSGIFHIDMSNHAINAYAIEKVSNNEYRLYVYDSNYPYNPNYIRDNQNGNIYITLTVDYSLLHGNRLKFKYNGYSTDNGFSGISFYLNNEKIY